jgi:pilus assembly protein FimV
METTMSESRTQLEEILELLLAEENEKAEEMLHEYVVAKARAEYENILDEDSSAEEDSEEAVEENIADIDPAGSLVDEILQDEEEIEGDEVGEDDGEEMDDMEAPEEEGDLEDKVDDISAELEELKAEFEKLLADDEEEGEEVEDGEKAELEMGDELDLESVEYDLDEEVTDEDEVVEEATKLSDNVAAPKAPTADNNDAPLPSGGSKVEASGSPVKITDGSEGDHGDSAKDHTPTDNIKVEPKKV